MSRTILFTGGDTQTGTTMISLAAAEELARAGDTVLYIGAGFCAGDEYLPQGLLSDGDGLVTGLMADNLSGEDLQKAVVNHRNIDILTGIRRTRQGTGFLPADLEFILNLAGDIWEWIVIDGGFFPSCEPALLYRADQIWAVITQQEKTICRFRRWNMADVLQIHKPVRYVVNKYNDSGAFYTVREMAETFHCEEKEIVTVPYVPYGWQAEAERTTLLNFRRFRKAVQNLTEHIKKGERHGTEAGSSL